MIKFLKALLAQLRGDWFSVADFEKKVGRRPCVACIENNEGYTVALLCPYDMDAWFDAVLA